MSATRKKINSVPLRLIYGCGSIYVSLRVKAQGEWLWEHQCLRQLYVCACVREFALVTEVGLWHQGLIGKGVVSIY